MNKTHSIEIKVSPDEDIKLKQKAETLGMTVSGYLRFVGLCAKIKIGVNENVI